MIDRAIRQRNSDGDLLPGWTCRASAPAAAGGVGKHKALLNVDRLETLAIPRKIAGGRVAGRAPALAVEIRLAGFRVADQDVARLEHVRARAACR